jgi:hypothetical protein
LKILIEDLQKISLIFKKNFGRNWLKIFWRKSMYRSFKEKVFIQIFLKSFLLKIFPRVSEEIQRRSSEELDFVKIFMKDLRGISFFKRSQKYLGLGHPYHKNFSTHNRCLLDTHFKNETKTGFETSHNPCSYYRCFF